MSAMHEAEGELTRLLEGEGEFEHEHESEQFWSQLVSLARRGLQSPTLRSIAKGAARGALTSAADLLKEHEGELEGEFEGEFEYEQEHELNPVRKVYLDAMLEMEHMANLAASAEHEHEAEHFLPALIPLAARLAPMAIRALPKIARALPHLNRTIQRVGPQLARSITKVGQMMHRRPATRPLIRVLPKVVRISVGQIARQAAQGKPVTPAAARKLLARNVYRVIRSPRAVVRAAALSRGADKRYHRLVKTGRSPALSTASTAQPAIANGTAAGINGVPTGGSIAMQPSYGTAGYGTPSPYSMRGIEMNCRCSPAPPCRCGR